MTPRPLDGVRIVDISSFVAGPTASRILAELGADVIRVDPVSGAVDGNRWPVTESGKSLYWAALNQGKRSLAVDLRSDEGRELVTTLVTAPGANCGVLLENAAHAPWLGNDVLTRRRPDLIQVHISGNADGTPAVDYTVNAALGLPFMTGPENSSTPVNHVLPAWDLMTGMYAALGVVAALRRRDSTGFGSYIDVALADVALSSIASLGWVAEADLAGTSRERQGNALFGSFGNDFTTSDGSSVMVVGLTAGQWRALVEVTDSGVVLAALELHLKLNFLLEADRYAARDAISAVLRPWFESRTLDEITRMMAGTRVLWSPYRDLVEVTRNLRARNTDTVVEDVIQPGIGPMLASRSPLRWSGQYTHASTAPDLGQDTAEILSDVLKFDISQISGLSDAGIVRGVSNEK